MGDRIPFGLGSLDTDEKAWLLNKTRCGGYMVQLNITVSVLIALFGISSWVAINGIWAELPILVSELPEGWDLPTYLVLITQAANIGPLLFTLLRQYRPQITSLTYGSYSIIAIGFVACLLLALFWKHLIIIGGKQSSFIFLFLAFVLALTDCTSSVVFLPYMAKYPPGYMIAFYIGEGMSGVTPSLLGLVQGAGGDTCYNPNNTDTSEPRFSSSVYFSLLSLLMAVSCGSFFLLNNLSSSLNERYRTLDTSSPTEERPVNSDNATSPGSPSEIINLKQINVKDVFCPFSPQEQVAPIRRKFLNLYLIIGLVCALGNGVLPAISAYAYLPYGPTTYHLATELSLLANPLLCFAAFYHATKSPKILNVLTALSVAMAVIIIYTATQSPSPWLMNTSAGSVLIILVCVAWTGCISYIKLCVASILRDYGENALIWCGFVTQLGSCIGAVVIFVVTFKTKAFTPC